MTTPHDDSTEPVDLTKAGGSARPGEAGPPLDFDPYRYGLPDHPVPAEYAPHGYVPPAAPAEPWSPYGPSSPYGAAPPPQARPYDGPPPHSGPYGQNPYGQSPYSGYGYPGVEGSPAGNPTHNRGKAIASMVCGIVSIVLCWLTLFDAALVIPGIVLALIVLTDKRSVGRGMAIAGLICSIVGAAAAIALLIWLVPIARDCGDQQGVSQQQCIQDHL